MHAIIRQMWSNTPSTNSCFQKRGHLKGSKRESIKNTNCRMWDEKSWKSSMLQIIFLLPSSLFPFLSPLMCPKSHPQKVSWNASDATTHWYFTNLIEAESQQASPGVLQFVSESLLNHHTYYLKLFEVLEEHVASQETGFRGEVRAFWEI